MANTGDVEVWHWCWLVAAIGRLCHSHTHLVAHCQSDKGIFNIMEERLIRWQFSVCCLLSFLDKSIMLECFRSSCMELFIIILLNKIVKALTSAWRLCFVSLLIMLPLPEAFFCFSLLTIESVSKRRKGGKL